MTETALAFLTVYVVVAGFEFLDRTNFSLISLAAREKPFPVWAGGSAAFLVTTVLSVGIGTLLLSVLPGYLVYLRLGGGLLLLAYAAYLALHHDAPETTLARRSVFLTAFLLILLLEIGDTTMILTINFLFSIPDPLLVGVAAAAGLVTVATSAALIGSHLGARVEPKRLERVVTVVLAVVGVATIAYALDPTAFPAL